MYVLGNYICYMIKYLFLNYSKDKVFVVKLYNLKSVYLIICNIVIYWLIRFVYCFC